MNQEEKVRTYTHNEVTVEWRAHLCIHSENCWRGLPSVFNPKQRPWVQPENATSDAVINQVRKCPSGALQIAGDKPSAHQNSGSIVAAKSPQEVELSSGKNYAWCSCGRSEGQPFCDGAHKQTDLNPLIFKAEKEEKAWLCRCKQTSNPPYCDGTHNSL